MFVLSHPSTIITFRSIHTPHGYTSTFAQSHLLFQRPTYTHSHAGAHTHPVGTHLHTITDTLTLSPAYIFTHIGTTLISPWWLSLLPSGQVSNLDLDLTESVFGGWVWASEEWLGSRFLTPIAQLPHHLPHWGEATCVWAAARVKWVREARTEMIRETTIIHTLLRPSWAWCKNLGLRSQAYWVWIQFYHFLVEQFGQFTSPL